MKKSVLSITVLIMLVAATLAFIGSSAACAAPMAKYTYNNKGNTQTVYVCDPSTLTLTPLLKYEYAYGTQREPLAKTAFRWNLYKKEWDQYEV